MIDIIKLIKLIFEEEEIEEEKIENVEGEMEKFRQLCKSRKELFELKKNID